MYPSIEVLYGSVLFVYMCAYYLGFLGGNMKHWLLAIIVLMNCSAYTHTGNPTASGVMPKEGMCAVDRINGITVPFGTKITLPNGKILTVEDRFGANHDNRLDIFMESESACWKFGRKMLKCEVEL